ncbi:M57 family metalloprotease [Hymenobacter psychrophilus]|uniref:Dual-action HEIGH metallo-peptidase n=1 Tax=Hymenobacter psychrophilus TaxID=651662 RepID=A0A1H3M743_9BACT|nr:M57 family metalloprotease [Hymenobacter psychrophilus]SDY72541.1 Dual-action HEIGH metallo-peptidase [Hymenobacter psychrophilus]
MKKNNLLASLALLAATGLSLSSCQEKDNVTVKNEVSETTINQVKALGFTATGAQKVDGGVVVEGDILLTNEMLASKPEQNLLRVGQDEQYRTTNLVSRLPRVLTVSVSSQFPNGYVQAADEAIRRYNAMGLRITMRRITSGSADLPITYSADLGPGVLGRSGGFPSNGNPAPGFQLAPSVIGARSINNVATIMAHEMGHCIGFRHTDYFNRAYSCGGAASNEGASSIGAILIPGTPSGADPNSWMLACIGSTADRPFNANDQTALNYVY